MIATQNCVKVVEAIYSRFLNMSPLEIDRTSTAYLTRLHQCQLKMNDNPVYLCDQCGGAFKDLTVFVKHLQNHITSARSERGCSSGFQMFYCPRCQLPYRAVIPYIKHLKKHLIAVVRFNGIREQGMGYDFSQESYHDSGSLECPVTDCGLVFKRQLKMIEHMEDHLEKLGEIAGLQTAYDDFVPVKGRPPLLGKEAGRRVTADVPLDGSLDVPELVGQLERDPISIAAEDDGKALSPAAPLTDGSADQPAQVLQSLYCHECEKTFVKPSLLLKHKHEEHSQVITTCSFCSRRMKNTLDLFYHVALAHDSFQPEEIGLAGEPKAGSKRKSAVHDRIFRCDECNTDFEVYKELLKHQHYVHATTDKKCRLCGKGINSYPSLIGHVNSCHGSSNS